MQCDCPILHKNCVTHVHEPQSSGPGAEASGSSGLETFLVVLAFLVMIMGCGGIVWFFMKTSSNPTIETQRMDEDIDDAPKSSTTARRTKKNYDRAGDLEMEEADDRL